MNTASSEETAANRESTGTRPRTTALVALSLLYTAQGIPFGIANDFLVVALRRLDFSRLAIAAASWLQLPWQMKVLWAHLPDNPAVARRTNVIVLVLQLGLALLTAAYAPFDLAHSTTVWFVLTAASALFAATQDVFVDALAVRALGDNDRGLGNSAQVGGYRLGILLGGAGLLSLSATLGTRWTFLACALLLALTSPAAFLIRTVTTQSTVDTPHVGFRFRVVWKLITDSFTPSTRIVMLVALTYKLGFHMSSSLIKPMVVDAGWTNVQISTLLVVVGSIASVVGALLGGVLHRVMSESQALRLGVFAHVLSCLALVPAAALGSPHALTGVMIAFDHLAGSLGTTVLFAALMTATRRTQAGLHYTLLSSANNVALAVGGLGGSLAADVLGGFLRGHMNEVGVFVVAALVSLWPLVWLRDWEPAATASAGSASAG